MATQPEGKELRALRRRRRLRQLLGAVVCVLVVIGLFSVVSGGIQLGAALFDDTEEKEAYELRLRNLVALDPTPFDSLDEANKNTLLNALIWSCIGDSSSYEHDETGAMYLPTIDIDKAAAELYGPDFKFTYETFEDHGMTFEYVAEKQAYLLPVTSAVNDYFPKVERIKREGDTKRVTVGYLSPFSAGGEFSSNMDITPTKYQDYIFTKIDGEYYLSAIVASEMKPETASSSSVAAESVVTAPQEVMDDLANSLPTDSSVAQSQLPEDPVE